MNQIEQKKAAKEFVERWRGFNGTELEGCQKYWMDLLVNVFGLPATLQGVEFERKVKGRRIDVFYEDMGVLVEQKAPGLDLDRQYERGKDEGGDARLVTPYQQGKWYAVSVNIFFTISTNIFSPIAPPLFRRPRQRGCAASG